MLETKRVTALFVDARLLYGEAIGLLEYGKLRIAAEVAWGATKRATDALILSRTGEEPRSTAQTSGGVRALSRQDQALEVLRASYRDRARLLHGKCFYHGDCEPRDTVVGVVRGTADYIHDTSVLAET